MKIGVIADDFTGASDIALTLAEAGMSVAQFIGVPQADADPELGAGVVALKSRTAPVAQAVQESLAACRWLQSQGAQQIILKVCSTFDSTAEGNIGPVLDALATQLQAQTVIVCPAFPENGRSVYMGHLFVNDGLLNESGMQDHPLTPMIDADIRRVLASQTSTDVHHIPAIDVMKGAQTIREKLPRSGFVIVDAIRDEDLLQIGKAAADQTLLCGGSGIALALPANFGAVSAPPAWLAMHGAGVVISGSCSCATRAQVAAYKSVAPSYEITAQSAVEGRVDVQDLAKWVLTQDAPPLVYSSADPSVVKAAQDQFGRDRSAEAIETLFSNLAAELSRRGVTRIVVAGGETSGAVVKGLGAQVLNIGPRLAAGVPMVRVDQDRPLALALKSGNFGHETFFSDALAKMEQTA
ncbi:3-oxo-tetronate kinase [Aestuariibius sp. HNIBRBA575]|uniref:3-oxo-tetronate kinase n=1 Tax=Aestuariibius sp. HNIBRBA575 TaxID=3233343 RepID=UPI0034A29BA6